VTQIISHQTSDQNNLEQISMDTKRQDTEPVPYAPFSPDYVARARGEAAKGTDDLLKHIHTKPEIDQPKTLLENQLDREKQKMYVPEVDKDTTAQIKEDNTSGVGTISSKNVKSSGTADTTASDDAYMNL